MLLLNKSVVEIVLSSLWWMVWRASLLSLDSSGWNKEYFSLAEMRFSVARSARSSLPVRRQSADDPPSSDHSLSVHSTSLLQCYTPPLPSPPSFLICPSHPRRSLLARYHSSSPATAQEALLFIVSPASCCFVVCLCLAPVCVRALMQYNIPALGGCSACSGRFAPLARQSGCQSCFPKVNPCQCIILCL